MNPDGQHLTRRQVLGRAIAAGAAASIPQAVLPRIASGSSASFARPNILFVMVDQLRELPSWASGLQPMMDQYLPNLARMRSGAVRFGGHYAAANACTASRGAILTGLYPHQTGVMLTAGNPSKGEYSNLDPGLPTWGSYLQGCGYSTSWFGKWHLSHSCGSDQSCDLGQYGFANAFGGDNGSPGAGLKGDAGIVDAFNTWYANEAGSGPWCTAVSLLNPHDINWWPTTALTGEGNAPKRFTQPPPNFESLDQLVARGKPRLQIAAKGLLDATGGPGLVSAVDLLNDYLYIQQLVDVQVGRILDTLEANPAVSANTVVIFTSDHGEYGGSHGLHTKGFAAYEEGIRVPLYVKDPRGVLTSNVNVARTQLTSTVDLIGLMLTIGSGSQAWRTDSATSYLGGRADIAGICADPTAAGRAWIAHVTDEDAEGLPMPGVPRHVVAVRTPQAKIGLYSQWLDNTTQIDPRLHQDIELYDYSTRNGALEIDNVFGRSALAPGMLALLEEVLSDEIHAPLPASLAAAQARGLAAYYAMKAPG